MRNRQERDLNEVKSTNERNQGRISEDLSRDGLSREDYRANDFSDYYNDNFQYEDQSRFASSRGDDREQTLSAGSYSSPDEGSGDYRYDQGHNQENYHAKGHRAKSHRGKGPKGHGRTDERLKEEICEKLTDHHEIDASEIEVEVRDGQVVFSGTVTDKWMKYQAEDLVEKIKGVKEVKNDIRVIRDYVQSSSPPSKNKKTSSLN